MKLPRHSALSFGVIAALAIPVVLCAHALTDEAVQPDKYQWLEEVSSAKSMAWVKAENARTAKVLESDPHFATLDAEALKILESPQRLPFPFFREKEIYNTWKDGQHVIGILRRTSLADYLTSQPHWQTVLDYDALAKKDNEKWVEKGLTCVHPEGTDCLVQLSAGGEDAVTMREFDLKAGKFVEGGFVLPHSKQNVDFADKDTLIVARDWGAGTMTTSGYPFVMKAWKRGQPLEQATEIFRGKESDMMVEPDVWVDGQGNRAVVLNRWVNFFEHEFSLWTPSGLHRVALPAKTDVNGLLDGKLIVTLNQDWSPAQGNARLPQGSVVALDLKAMEQDPENLKPETIFAPTAVEFAQQVSITRNHLIMTTLENVQGRAYVYTASTGSGWTRKKLPIPDNQSVEIENASLADDQFFLSVDGILTPSTLLLGDAASNHLKQVKSLPAQFDAKDLMVEQLSATSKDGTRVPYFVARRKDLAYNGENPTLLSAYGGFQISETPQYSPTLGKLWMERGGVYVLANIRGGGEFGPAWHEAGLTTHRQRIYDDFAAVGQDLVTRKITSPRRLGIYGGSNGGLLMGVEMTQHPDMWNAIVIDVPLMDMLGFEHIAAGASWVGEYGSVSVPEQQAFLASISPYNQLKPDVQYPEPLIFTTTKDDRVGPVHARKFAAKMEEFHEPFFYDEITEGGHALGADLKEEARTYAERYTYLSRKLMN